MKREFKRVRGLGRFDAIILIFSGLNLFQITISDSVAQSIVVSGYVSDAHSGEALIGANLYEIYQHTGTSTNQYGFFSLAAPSDSAVIQFSYQGYETVTKVFQSPQTELQQIELQSTVVEYDSSLVIQADKMEGLHHQIQMSNVKISMNDVENLPALLGETDLMKVLQLMPGVQSGTEGTTGLYVRGGSPGQTLILLDGATVYNASHLFGFMSTFNTDAINSVELFKGGFPARYGGRLSGILDITMREGNRKEFEGRGSIGVVASRVTVEGPLLRDQSSFIISARRTYLDIINWGIQRIQGSETILGYYFEDLNAKWNMDLSKYDRFYMSIYAGRDKGYERDRESFDREARTEYDYDLSWKNLIFTSRWNRVINSRMFVNTTVLFSHYSSRIREKTTFKYLGIDSFQDDRYENGLSDWSVKSDWEYFPHRNHQVRFGAMVTHHFFTPSNQRSLDQDERMGSNATTKIPYKLQTTEWSAYMEDRIIVTPQIEGDVGVHISGYHTDGTMYSSVQPRVSASYLLSQDWAIKFSYVHMQQYVQLLSNSGSGIPIDLWLPTTSRVPPQKAWQAAVGVAHLFDKEAIDISIEGFYKGINNTIAYKYGNNLLAPVQGWEDAITIGRGWVYGKEIYLHKKQGKITGWLSYTLSWSQRQFPDLNEGRAFYHRYDRRHDVSIVLMYELGKRKLSATWVFSTGNAITLPHSRYREHGNIISVYGSHNSYRTQPYHRLDLSMRQPAQMGKRSEIIFSLYNVYSRRNIFYVYPEDSRSIDPIQGHYIEERTIKKYSLLPIVPSVSYRFFF